MDRQKVIELIDKTKRINDSFELACYINKFSDDEIKSIQINQLNNIKEKYYYIDGIIDDKLIEIMIDDRNWEELVKIHNIEPRNNNEIIRKMFSLAVDKENIDCVKWLFDKYINILSSSTYVMKKAKNIELINEFLSNERVSLVNLIKATNDYGNKDLFDIILPKINNSEILHSLLPRLMLNNWIDRFELTFSRIDNYKYKMLGVMLIESFRVELNDDKEIDRKDIRKIMMNELIKNKNTYLIFSVGMELAKTNKIKEYLFREYINYIPNEMVPSIRDIWDTVMNSATNRTFKGFDIMHRLFLEKEIQGFGLNTTTLQKRSLI